METLTMMNAIMYPLLVDSDIWENPYLLEETESASRNKWIKTKDGYLLEVEVSGFSKNELKVEVEGDQLHIKAERKKGEQNGHRIKQAVYALPKDADAQQIEAKCENGLLTVRLQKRAAKQARRISVNGPSAPRPTTQADWRQRLFSLWKNDKAQA